MEEKKEFVENQYGIRIVKCCQSCAFKMYDREGTRKCQLKKNDGRWKRVSLCELWEMNGKLATIGSQNSQEGLRIGIATFTRGWRSAEKFYGKKASPNEVVLAAYKENSLKQEEQEL